MADPAGVSCAPKTRQKRRWTSWNMSGSAVSGGAPVVARRKWENLSAYLRYPANIRKAGLATPTNAIESVHRQFRKLTKTKGAFPNENSLLKLLYLGPMNAQENGQCRSRAGI